MKLYIVKMNRWGDPENHSYVIGVFSTKELAEQSGQDEEQYRGGKYEAWIKECELDKNYSSQYIRISKNEMS